MTVPLMREDRLLARAVEYPVLFDAYGVVHRVWNTQVVWETYRSYGYVENWQVRVVCKPYKAAPATLELHGRPIDQADLGDESRGDFVTCLACACGINIKEW